jgi:hypothetical protein
MNHIPAYVLDNARCTICGGIQIRHSGNPNLLQQMLNKISKGRVEMRGCTCDTPTVPPIVQKDQHKGKTAVICGSGPSLKKAFRRIKRGEFDHVWACNDALMWLTSEGYTPTYGVGIDQSDALYAECWVPPPDVPYLIATSVDPKLVAHLKAHNRKFTFFHSHIGFTGEHHLYALLFGRMLISGEGLNVVNRAIGVAEYMGYRTIYVAGADCAFGRDRAGKDTFHVHGDLAEGVILRTEKEGASDEENRKRMIGGRHWATKPDMLISAISLVGTKERMGSKLQWVGDILPRALARVCDDLKAKGQNAQEFLDRCIRWASEDEMNQQNAAQAIAEFAPRLDSTQIKELLAGKKG